MLVSNTGDEPLTDVTPVSGVIIVGMFGAPTVVVGNADAVLDPGEEWLYLPTGSWWTSTTASVTVHATQPDGSPVSVVATVDFPALSPVVATVTPSALSVTSGATVRWIAEATNRADFPVGPHSVETRVLSPNWFGPIAYDEVTALPTGDANANGLLDPGETWRWEIDAPVLVDQSYLDLFASSRTPDFVLFIPWQQSPAQAITVLPPTTTAPTTTAPTAAAPTSAAPIAPTPTIVPSDLLPVTGTAWPVTRMAMTAALTIVAGLALIRLARRGGVDAGAPQA